MKRRLFTIIALVAMLFTFSEAAAQDVCRFEKGQIVPGGGECTAPFTEAIHVKEIQEDATGNITVIGSRQGGTIVHLIGCTNDTWTVVITAMGLEPIEWDEYGNIVAVTMPMPIYWQE